MSTGQVFLTLGAVILFMITSLNVNRSYVNAVKVTTGQQVTVNAMHFGQSVVESVYSQSQNYSDLLNYYSQFDDITNPNRRLHSTTETGDSLAAQIEISPEKVLMHGVEGRIFTISVYELLDGNTIEQTQHTAAILKTE